MIAQGVDCEGMDACRPSSVEAEGVLIREDLLYALEAGFLDRCPICEPPFIESAVAGAKPYAYGTRSDLGTVRPIDKQIEQRLYP